MMRSSFRDTRVTGASLSTDRYAFIDVPLSETTFLIAVWKFIQLPSAWRQNDLRLPESM